MNQQCNGGSRCKRPRSLGGYCTVHWMSRQARRHRLPTTQRLWRDFSKGFVQALNLRLTGVLDTLEPGVPPGKEKWLPAMEMIVKNAEAQIRRDSEHHRNTAGEA